MEFEKPLGVQGNKSEQVESFEQKAEQLGQDILLELAKKYPEAEYEYHNRFHSEGVVNQATELIDHLTLRQKALLRLIAYTHDYVQDVEEPWPSRGEGKVGFKRVRKAGEIETKSFETLFAKCTEVGLELTEEEKAIIQEATLATIPGWSMEYGTVIQPNLTEEAHNITFAIAAADIATSGYDPEGFLKDGDNVFNEDNLLPRPETLTEREAEQLLKEVLAWSHMQIQYATGQKTLWSREFIPDFIKSRLIRFDETIELCSNRYQERVDLLATGTTLQKKLQLLLDNMNFKRYIQ